MKCFRSDSISLWETESVYYLLSSIFKSIYRDANVKYISTSDQNDDLTRANCDIKTEKLALIAHGWRQDCNEDWVKQLVRSINDINIHQLFIQCVMINSYVIHRSN